MANWNLAEIRQKVRQVSGRHSTNEMSDAMIDEYINKYYQYTFPAEVKLERKHTFYEFSTTANVRDYSLPNSTYTNFEPPARIDNLHLIWSQDPAVFERDFPYTVSRDNSNTGNGTQVNFSVTTTPTPILPGTVMVTDNVEKFTDTNETWSLDSVNLVSDGAGLGTVTYDSGAISVTFDVAPLNGQLIYFSWISFKAGRPVAVLNYNNELQFYPVPDTAYRFRVKAYAIVSPLVNSTDKPDLEQWGPCIAYGAVRQILSDYGEMDAYIEVTALYKEQLSYVMNKTVQNLLNTRAAPNF